MIKRFVLPNLPASLEHFINFFGRVRLPRVHYPLQRSVTSGSDENVYMIRYDYVISQIVALSIEEP